MKSLLVSSRLLSNDAALTHKLLGLFTLGAVLSVFSASAGSVDENRLWLPLKYQNYFLPLKQAAAAAESLNRCVEVMDATLDLAQSTSETPIFRILCKQENKRSYVEMVDGVTMATLTTQEYPPLETMMREKDAYGIKCKQALLRETTKMQRFELLHDRLPEPVSIDEHHVLFHFNFDATNRARTGLKYRGVCRVNLQGEVSLKIMPRRD